MVHLDWRCGDWDRELYVRWYERMAAVDPPATRLVTAVAL